MGATGDTPVGNALVVDSDVELLAEIAGNLREAGFAVAAHSDMARGLEEARERTADVVVVGAAMALEYLATIAKETDHMLPRDIPVVLTASSADQVTSHPELAMRSSDYLLLPIASAELLHRVNTAIHRNRLRQRRSNESAFLRERVRAISEGIRHTNEPAKMVQLTLQGIGEALEADEVTLHIFDDERVSCDSARWLRGEGCGEPSDVTAEQEELRALGTDLWRTSGSLAVSPGRLHEIPGQLSNIRARMEGFTRSGLLLPIGEGASSFGVLWIAANRGHRKWSSTEIALLQHLIGNLAYGMIQGQLILGQQQVVDRLRELDAARDGFIATIHHELRTPLASILGYVELLQEGDAGELPATARKMLSVIERNGQRLSTLVENVLALSVLDAGTRLGNARIDLVPLVDSVVADLMPLAAAKHISIRVAPVDSPQHVQGVGELLKRAFVNVLSNAVKFTPDGGTVTVTYLADEPQAANNSDDGGRIGRGGGADNGNGVHSSGTVRIAVQDSGIGIPAEELPHLLTRFYRASNSVAAEIPGTGLGLPIAAQSVERHGGTFSIQSELGSGTTVTIGLPRA